MCVCRGEGVRGRIQDKIITANWPEALFPSRFHRARTHKTPAAESC